MHREDHNTKLSTNVHPFLNLSSSIFAILCLVHQSIHQLSPFFLHPSSLLSYLSVLSYVILSSIFAVQQTQMLAQHLCNLHRGHRNIERTFPGPRVCASACPSSSSSSSRSHTPAVARMRLGCTDSADFLSDGCKKRVQNLKKGSCSPSTRHCYFTSTVSACFWMLDSLSVNRSYCQ